MKKSGTWLMIGIMSVGLAFICVGCESSDEEGGGLFSAGDMDTSPVTWDMMLTPMGAGMDKYFIRVTSGGSLGGYAVVTIFKKSGGVEQNLGNEVPFSGVPIPLEICGPAVTFSGAGAGLSLGDEWAVMNVGGQIMGPFPTGVIGSTATIAAGPDPGCGGGCPNGLFTGTPLFELAPGMGANVLPGLRVGVGDYSIEGEVPEVYLLNFQTGFPVVATARADVRSGDQIEVSYKRRIFSDGEGEDFLYVRLVNHRDYETIEAQRENNAPDPRTVTYQTTANGRFLGVIFSVGLSSPGDKVILDDFRVSVNGSPLFSDNFEGPTLKPGLPDVLWTSHVGVGEKGVAGMTTRASEVISGSQSWRFLGGRSFYIYGQQAEFDGMTGMQFNMVDNSIGTSYFMGMFMGATEQNIIAGNYGGKNYDESCTEDGGFFVTSGPTGSVDASGTWEISLDADLTNCDDPTWNRPFNMTYSGVTINQSQMSLGAVLTGNMVADDEGNQVQFGGFVTGSAVIMQAVTAVPASMFYSAALSGGAGEVPVSGEKLGGGQVFGFAAPDPARMWETCDIMGTYEASAP